MVLGDFLDSSLLSIAFMMNGINLVSNALIPIEVL